MTSIGFWICTMILGGCAAAALWSLLAPEAQCRSPRTRNFETSLLAHAYRISMGICVFTLAFLAASMHDTESALLLLAPGFSAYALTALASGKARGQTLGRGIACEAGEFLTALGAVLLAFVLTGLSQNSFAWAVSSACLTVGIIIGLLRISAGNHGDKPADGSQPSLSGRFDEE